MDLEYSTIWLISPERVIGFSRKFYGRCILEQESPCYTLEVIRFGSPDPESISGCGLRIETGRMLSLTNCVDEQIRSNEAVVKLVRDIGGPLDIELQLNMHIYSREYGSDEIFYGTAVARICIYITDDPW